MNNTLEVLTAERDQLAGKLQALDAAIAIYEGSVTSPSRKPRKPRKTKAGSVQTRTLKDREAYDASILTFIKKSRDEVRSKDVRTACGGSPGQARKALNRLIEVGSLLYSGQAAGTKYEAA